MMQTENVDNRGGKHIVLLYFSIGQKGFEGLQRDFIGGPLYCSIDGGVVYKITTINVHQLSLSAI